MWLNEGFATYIASLGVDHLHPEWNSLEEESVDNTLDIFKFDALKSSHGKIIRIFPRFVLSVNIHFLRLAVSVEIGHPNQISQIFDAISYEKGSTILRMMHLFLGESAFRDGVSNYLVKHKYKNAVQDDLWASLTDQAHHHSSIPDDFSVKEVMDSWTLQVGYPIISVERNYDTNSATLTQVRYLSDRYRVRSDLDHCWWVPLTYTDAEEVDYNVTHVSANKVCY